HLPPATSRVSRHAFRQRPLIFVNQRFHCPVGGLNSANLKAAPMARLSILLVDDDAELCNLMVEFFAQHDIDIQFANNGERGLNLALNGTFDLILLDVMMPGMDGFSVLRQIRRRSPMPVIMLTARTEHGDRIEGLNAGADDYLAKPFSPDELLARIQAVPRRSGRIPSLKPEM